MNYAGTCGRCKELIEAETLEEFDVLQRDHQNYHQIEDGNPLFDNYERPKNVSNFTQGLAQKMVWNQAKNLQNYGLVEECIAEYHDVELRHDGRDDQRADLMQCVITVKFSPQVQP